MSPTLRRFTPHLHQLEDRSTPATISGNTITLDDANELLTVSYSGTYSITSSTDGTLSFTPAAGTVSIVDSATGTSVTFANSSATYANPFDVMLDSAPGTVTFDGTSAFDSNNLSVSTTRNLSVSSAATLSAGSGNITLLANSATSTAGNFKGITVEGTVSGGDGTVTLTGKGGTDTNGTQYGVWVRLGGVVTSSGSGAVSVTGTGGAGGTGANNGVVVENTNSLISSGGGAVSVTGQGGGSGTSGSNFGVVVQSTGTISAGSTGTVTVTGTGGSGSGSNNIGVLVQSAGQITSAGTGTVTVMGTGGSGSGSFNFGASVDGTDAKITSGGGAVQVTGQGGGGTGSGNFNYGVRVQSAGQITSAVTGTVTVMGTGGSGSGTDNFGVAVDSTGQITSAGTGTGTVTVTGTGGTGSGGFNIGVLVQSAGQITSAGTGTVTVTGTGGSGSGDSNIGVRVFDTDAKITSGGGAVSVTGQGGGGSGSGSFNIGVFVQAAGQITSAGTGTVTVTGTGGSGSGTDNTGVAVGNTGQITSAGTVTVMGTGGSGSGNSNDGVVVTDTDSKITSGSGNVEVTGQGGGSGTSFSDIGVSVTGGGSISAGGTGTVIVLGTGGTGTGGDSYGVNLGNATVETTGSGSVSVTGSGGVAGGDSNYGVYVNTSTVRTADGDVIVTGTGGGSGTNGFNFGVFFLITGQVAAGGSGTATVSGTGGLGSGGSNRGVYFNGVSAGVTTNSGAVTITGTGGGGSDSFGIYSDGGIVASGGTAGVTLTADSMLLDFLDVRAGTAGDGTATLRPRTAGTLIDLGGADGMGVLGLTDAELGTVTAGVLVVGDSAADDITVVNPLTAHMGYADLRLVTGGDIFLNADITTAAVRMTAGGSVRATASPTDVTASTGLTFGTGTALRVNVTGTTGDTDYEVLGVDGPVDLTGLSLTLTGTFVPAAGDSFRVVSAGSVSGTFTGLPNGSVVTFNGVSLHVVYSSQFVTLVANSAPTGADPGSYTINEGDGLTVTTPAATDPDGDTPSYTWDVNGDGTFGDEADGTVTDGGRTVTFTAAQLAALGLDDGPFSTSLLAVRVSDGLSGGTVTATGSLAITNVAPVVAVSGGPSVGEGSPFTLTLGAITDPGPDAVTQYVVNWGDGTSDTYATAGPKAHTYADDGSYAITVDLTDEDGTHLNCGNAVTAVISNVGPTITTFTVPGFGTAGTGVSVSAAATDPAGSADPLTFTWDVDRGGVPFATGSGASFTFTPDAAGTYEVTVIVTDGDGGSTFQSTTVDVAAAPLPPAPPMPPMPPPLRPVVVTAVGGTVSVFSPSDGTTRTLTPYPGFGGGLTVASADLDGDGFAEVVTGAGPGGGPHVKVFDGQTLAETASFFAYAESFGGGVFVAAAGGRIVTGAGAGGGPHVRVLTPQGVEVSSFFAFDPSFAGGVRVAAGDLNGDGVPEVVVGAGPGGGPNVRTFTLGGGLAADFQAFAPAFGGGVFVAAGGGRIAVGADAGGGPHVKAFDAGGTERESFFAFDESFTGGVRVALADADADADADLIAAAGPGGGPNVRAYSLSPFGLLTDRSVSDPADLRGVFVG